jgi:hypothetical protein
MAIVTNDWTGRITGAAYSDLAANKITAPHGKYIIAIRAVGLTTTSNVMTKLVAADSSMYPNSEAAAHIGTASDIVDHGASETISAGTAITMTTSYATKGYAVGWYVDGVGVPYGTKVSAVNVGSDVKEIKLDTDFVCTDGQTIYFTNPNDTVHGTGGRATTTGTDMALVAEGETIYGRWLSCTVETEDGGGIIAYFGE